MQQAKPFLKWAGGKGQLISKFQKLYPTELQNKKIERYYEPFVGGGAVFFDIAQQTKLKSACLYDINDELILTYRVIQKDVDKLIDFLFCYSKQYLPLDAKKRKEYYYNFRQNFNLQRFNIDFHKYSDNWISRAAQIIFLNKTCFNGLFRFNSKGEFNTPAGDYKNPNICDEQNLLAVSKVLDIAEIKNAGFEQVLHDVIEPKSFVYFDPPYRPISKTASFTSYSKHEFGDVQQKKLADVFKGLDEKNIKAMLSNSDPKNLDANDDFFDDLYNQYHIVRIPATRMINSDATKRGKINEIVVTNYPINR